MMSHVETERMLKALERIEEHLSSLTYIIQESQITQRQYIHTKECNHMNDSLQSYLLCRLSIETKIPLDRIIYAEITMEEWVELTNQAAILADSVNFPETMMKEILQKLKPNRLNKKEV